MTRTLSPEARSGGAPRQRQFDGPQPGKVLRVDGEQLFVELDSARGLEVGPVAWSRPLAPHSHSSGDGGTDTYTPPTPPAGTRLLVLFAAGRISDPWVVGWSGWPA